jgi:hypothetical protein
MLIEEELDAKRLKYSKKFTPGAVFLKYFNRPPWKPLAFV